MRPTALRLSRALVLLAALLVAATACGEASATRPCWKQVQDDWTDNGTIDNTYKPNCYDQAIKKLPHDLFIYSDAPDVISAAKQNALKEEVRRPAGVNPGGSNSSGGSGGSNGGSSPEGPADVILNAGSTTTDGMPLPLLVLGGVAILLLAAGAVGVTSRHVQARRTPPPE